MRVVVYPADSGACGHYRLVWPSKALIDQGADVGLHHPTTDEPDIEGVFQDDYESVHGMRLGRKVATRVVNVVRPDADVIVLQRPLRRWIADAIPLLQDKGVRVVVEVDDDFARIHPNNVSFSGCHPRTSPDRNWAHLKRACDAADLVTVTTPALAKRYGAHGRVAVLPNLVPAWYLTVERDRHDGVYVGWSGSIDTHPDDLQVTGGGVAVAVRDTGARFAVVGTGKGVQRGLGLDAPPVATGWRPLEEYPVGVAQLDVGIVPLADTDFNHAKSNLKMSEMSALGVPPVGSPTPDNVRLGCGLLARRPRDWAKHLRLLVRNSDYRAEVAAHGRTVMAGRTIEGNCGRWLDAWLSTVERKVAA